MTKTRKNLVAAIVITLFALFYFGTSYLIEGEGARMVPQMLGICFILLSALNLWQCYRQDKEASGEEEGGQKSNYKRVVLTLLFIALYAAGLEILGFLLSSVLFLGAMMYLLAPDDKRSAWKIGLLSIVCTGAIYALFRFVFVLALPPGIFG